MELKDLNPQLVWKNFYSLTRIPRPSKKEGKAVEFLYDFGKSLGLETIKDEVGNIIIRKPATPGMENRKGVILQGHIDMVPQKNADKVHDFEKDPIDAWVDGEWVRAKGTTLGADNGLGVAVAMSVLESKDLKHGPVEVLVTIDEETGMTGARALKPGILKGDILINLDSETEGELYVGCAGGLDITAELSYRTVAVPSGYKPYLLTVKGLKGGHSGMDIVLYRANANKVMARALLPLLRDSGVKLVSIDGGSLRNAIPREAFAHILVPEDKVAAIESIVEEVASAVRSEYAATDPDAAVFLEEAGTVPAEYIEESAALAAVRAVSGCPDGVWRMSDAVPGLVETSNNTAIVKSDGGRIFIKTLMRSSVDTAKEAMAEQARAVFELAGFKVDFSGGYPGWAPDSSSPILHAMKEVYKGLYGKEPAVMAIHAGLECGILGGAYPHWDMVSCGPTILSPHSPDERANIATVEKWWKFVIATLENIPEK
ncbi:MAG: aminoacyl-histidine dipeptidase [Bacteroidetes bacterium]|uniref:Cytosol non-specific dipeptidase n=1 Tax=Candidatus Cryptobacteroides avicola TaxID=2840757 RepID=A0A940DRW3_9BACT|nr:aminoacyl-histidine dipeptidase [Candidatus Cryptobacteroides avicola]